MADGMDGTPAATFSGDVVADKATLTEGLTRYPGNRSWYIIPFPEKSDTKLYNEKKEKRNRNRF